MEISGNEDNVMKIQFPPCTPDNIQSSRYYTTYLIIYAVILSYFWDSATTVSQLVYLFESHQNSG